MNDLACMVVEIGTYIYMYERKRVSSHVINKIITKLE